MDAFKQHGAFSWCELMTTDVGAAKKFYAELLGGELEEGGPSLHSPGSTGGNDLLHYLQDAGLTASLGFFRIRLKEDPWNIC